jgi:ABC-type transport system involved in cytochrome bd biosynthesis fused ATPase/permease subunit
LSNILRAFSDRIVIVVTHDPAVASRMQNVLTLSSRVEAPGDPGESYFEDGERPEVSSAGYAEIPEAAGRGEG